MDYPHRKAELQLSELRQQLASGKLDQNAFQVAVAALRAVDPAGVTWQLSPDGNWLRWDGAQWLPGDPHGDQFDDAAARFRSLHAQRVAGQIDEAGYAAAVGGIRIEEADGSQWSVHPQTGAWLRWDGSAWQEAEPPRRGADGRPAVRPSVFVEFEDLYKGIFEQLQQNKISREEFDARVAKLRVTDEEGAWWQISPETGGWLKWDGQNWAPAQPPRETVSAVGPARKLAQTVVEGTKEELKSTVKSLPRIIFRMVVSRAIMFVIAFLTARYLNAYWAGYKNDGFRDDGGPWSPWLYLTQSQHGNSFAFIWGMGGMLLGSAVQSMISRGPIGGIVGMVRAPFAMLSRLKGTGKLGIGALILGAGAALLVGSRLPINPQASLALAIGLLFAGAGRSGYYVAKFLFGIVRRVITPSVASLKGKVPIDLRIVQMAIVGVAPGFYLASRLSDPSKPLEHGNLFIYGVVLTGIGVWLTFFSKKRLSPESVATMLLGGVFGIAAMIVIDLLHPLVAHADDGGADEFSGDPKDYWKTEGGKLLEHSKPPGEAAGIGSVVGGDTTTPPEPPPLYSYSLTLDHYSLTMTQSGEDIVRANVHVSGPDPAECANQEASLNAAISMRITGNIVEWFTPTIEADASGARCNFYVEVPEDPEKRKGPNVAYVSASVSTPKGALSARCRINMEVEGDYVLVMDAELKVKANESQSAYYAFVQCNDPALDGSEQLEKSRQLAPLIKFVLSGDQANWVGGPGPIEGYVSGDGKEIPVVPVVPAQDVGASPPFAAEVEVSCAVPLVGTLTKGGRIVIEPPDWFVELQVIKDTLVLDFKDAASFKVRLIPLDSSKLSLYVSDSGNMLNQYLQVRAEGGNAQYAVLKETEGDGEFRAFDVSFSESSAGAQQVEDYIDIVAEASLTGSSLSQTFRINLSGKASLEVQEKSVGIRAGGPTVDVHAKVKDGGDMDWTLHAGITGEAEVEPEWPPETGDDNAYTLKLRGNELPSGDLRPRTGTLKLSASATNPAGEEVTTEPVEVSLMLGAIGLSITPDEVTLPLDPAKQPAAQFKVKVLDYDEESQTFSGNPEALQNLEMEDWEDGEAAGGANTFVGAKVALAFLRNEGSGVDAAAIWTAKQEIAIPASQPIDAYRTLRAACGPPDMSALFEIRQKFVIPTDPAAAQAERLRVEQENCRKTLKYLPDGATKTKFSDTIERDAKTLGVEGLYHLRHEIWEVARKALTEEAESYLASARVLEVAENALDWVNYLCGLIVQGMSSILVPFPGDFVVGLLYQAIPDMVNAVREGKTAEAWAKEWVGGLVAGAPGMAVDVALGQVANLEKLFLQGIAEFKDPRKAAGMACLIFWEVRFCRYQVTFKPNGDPFSLKESITNSLKELAEEIITLGIGNKTKAAMGGSLPPGVKVTDDSTLADPDRGYDPKDGRRYEPAKGPPDLAGMPDANIKAAQNIANKHDVEVYIRPTNPASKALLEAGAHPKPETVKMKTINELDLELGRNPADLGKVGYFDPGSKPPRGDMPDAKYNDLLDRWKQRKAEFNNYKKDIDNLKAKGFTIDDKGVIYHSDGKPFTGDHDVFDIRGKNGERLPKSKYDAVMADLKKPPFSAQHDGHRQWDYSHASKKPKAGEPVSQWEKYNDVDKKILDSHSSTTPKGKPGEALIRVGPDGQIDGQHFNHSSRQPTHTPGQQAGRSMTSSQRHENEERNK